MHACCTWLHMVVPGAKLTRMKYVYDVYNGAIPFQYPLFKQCNSSWGSDIMERETICKVGCLMSSVRCVCLQHTHYIISHHITLHHITSHHITLHHITSHHITLHHITLHHITSHHITSHYITSHHIHITFRKQTKHTLLKCKNVMY